MPADSLPHKFINAEFYQRKRADYNIIKEKGKEQRYQSTRPISSIKMHSKSNFEERRKIAYTWIHKKRQRAHKIVIKHKRAS